MADMTVGEAYGGGADAARLRPVTLLNMAGGVLSLALIVGIGVWGTKIILRDVSGVPVVRAMHDGPMRVAPDNPGGDVAPHRGLTVNSIAAMGEAAGPGDRLVLAPRAVDVLPEDLELSATAEAGEVEPLAVETLVAASAPAPDAPLTDEAIDALASQLAAASLPAPEVIDPSIPGPSRSLRPVLRVAGIAPAAASAAPVVPASAPAAEGIEVVRVLPAGMALAQLGAFESPEVATSEWDRLSGRFAEFLGGHAPLIQQAQTSGSTFYRLRVGGFADLSDSRRFCAALVAEGAACIPVVTR